MSLNKPLQYYTDNSSLRFHLLDVGEGLMFLLIFPNSSVMLFDCNVTEENEDEVLRFLSENIPFQKSVEEETMEQRIDIFVNSHRDDDHLRGLKKVNEKYRIKTIWDSGQSGDTTDSNDYKYYMEHRRRLKSIDNGNVRELVPQLSPIKCIDSVDIYCLSSKAGISSDAIVDSLKKQHTNSVVLRIEYAGKSILLTGDSDWYAWKNKIIPNFKYAVKSNILIASHHGSRSFFTDESNEHIDSETNPDSTYIDSIKYISPDIVLIPCGNYETDHHPNKEAKEIYLENSKNNQVYSTHEKGHLSGFIDNSGNYTVVPSRFKDSFKLLLGQKAQIECYYLENGEKNYVSSGSKLLVGKELHFHLSVSSSLLVNYKDNVTIFWEVSNGGQLEDSNHQEIYYKDKDEKDGIFEFSRDLSYIGTHLLRCKYINKSQGQATIVFVIKGCK